MPEYAIGVDVGGTNIKLVLIDQSGHIYLRAKYPTLRNDSDPEQTIDQIITVTQAFHHQACMEGLKPSGVGFGVPFFADGQDWVLRQTNNLPALEGYPFYPIVHEFLGESVAITFDTNAAGIGEHLFGTGAGKDRMLLMAIGTGISTCFITKEQGLVNYSYGTMGDTGMIIIDPHARISCSCGGRGCLESLASGPAIRQRAMDEINRGRKSLLSKTMESQGNFNARDVYDAARAGDEAALDIFKETGYYLAIALASYLHIFRPHLIVLGGGVSQAGHFLIEPIRQTLTQLASPWYLNYLEEINISALGTEAGAIGAASLILYPGKYIQ